ncbi:hypothetical protein FRB99_000576 [Tulasnella sp. 403]|nr:hypothetical protein FRB99_000576 [Tulasnella sp. 403]
MTNQTDAASSAAIPSPPPSEVPTGIYILRNKRTKTCLDLESDKPEKACGWKIKGRSCFGNFLANTLWFIEKRASGGYYIRNAGSGKAMDLNDGKKDDGTRVQGYHFSPGNSNQCWDLIDYKGGYYFIQNVKAKTYLQLKDGSSDNGAETQCASYSEGDDNQLWFLDRRSRSTEEIQHVLRANPILSDLFERTNDENDKTQYITLPSRFLEGIYAPRSGLDKRIRRPGAFDYEDYVIKFKEVVTSWRCDCISLDGYRILVGIVHGSLGSERYSYNWALTDDRQSVIFFDPYLGEELTTVSLEKLGFKALIATL